VRLTADRGFADAALFAVLDALGIRYIIRVKGDVKVELEGQWRKLNTLRFAGNARRRNLGCIPYCASSPQRLWITLSRARDKTGHWGIWYLVSNRPLRAQPMAREYSHRFCCEEDFRDAKWYLGFAKARITVCFVRKVCRFDSSPLQRQKYESIMSVRILLICSNGVDCSL
jgi:hypothetical protein